MPHLIHIEAFAGASGDMLLAALLDLGVPTQVIDDVVAALGLGPVRVELCQQKRRGIRGQHLRFLDQNGQPVEASGSDRSLRQWREIRSLVGEANLESRVKDSALGVLLALAEAEAEIHNIDVEDVHFHEIGAVDTLIDVVGFCAALAHLGWPRLSVGPLAIGRGHIATEHGVLPALAPATARLCRGLQLQGIDVEGESVTPTGAALLSCLAPSCETMPAGTLLGVGVGLGQRDPPQRANLLRVLHLSTAQAGSGKQNNSPVIDDNDLIELATNLDDEDPEHCAYVVQRLLDRGARDAWLTPIVMKKGRAAQTLRVLLDAPLLAELSTWILDETSALGVRWHRVQRLVLQREQLRVETSLGPVRVKRARRPGGRLCYKPEYEDCARLADEHNRPLIEIRQLACKAAESGSPP